jgi:hypothetical protein
MYILNNKTFLSQIICSLSLSLSNLQYLKIVMKLLYACLCDFWFVSLVFVNMNHIGICDNAKQSAYNLTDLSSFSYSPGFSFLINNINWCQFQPKKTNKVERFYQNDWYLFK